MIHCKAHRMLVGISETLPNPPCIHSPSKTPDFSFPLTESRYRTANYSLAGMLSPAAPSPPPLPTIRSLKPINPGNITACSASSSGASLKSLSSSALSCKLPAQNYPPSLLALPSSHPPPHSHSDRHVPKSGFLLSPLSVPVSKASH